MLSEQDKQLITSIWSHYLTAFPWFKELAVAPPPSYETLTTAMQTLIPAYHAVRQTAKPQDKKCQQVKKDVETVLDAWIKASEWGMKYSERPNRGSYGSFTFWSVLAIETMDGLNKKVAELR